VTRTGVFLWVHGELGEGEGQLNSPTSLTIDHDALLYITDSGNRRVVKWYFEGNELAAWPAPIGSDVPFVAPHDINLNWEKTALVATESVNSILTRLTIEGQYLGIIRSALAAEGRLSDPRGVATGPDDSIIVADAGNSRIQIFDADGDFMRVIESPGPDSSPFSRPVSVAVDDHGLVYVVESGNDRIIVLNLDDGSVQAEWGGSGQGDGQFSAPQGIAVAGNSVYVADTGNHRVQVFSRAGEHLATWGEQGDGSGQFSSPTDIEIVGDLVYVVDRGNDRVQVLDLDGNVVAGFGGSGAGDGQFQAPASIAIDHEGNLQVVDSLGARV